MPRNARALASMICATVGTSLVLVSQAVPAHALTYGFFAYGYSVQTTGAYSIECDAFFDDQAKTTYVVTDVTITDCYSQNGISAPSVTGYGPATATGAATDQPRRSAVTCVRAVFTYLDAALATRTHDTGLICTDTGAIFV